MARRVPSGFVPIAEAQKRRDGSIYSIIGVCSDYLPPAMTNGTDMGMKLTLWDTSCIGSEDVSKDGMVVRMFGKHRYCFPPVQNTGDVVIFRNIRTKSFGSQWFGLTSYDTKWVVIEGTSLMDSADSIFSDIEYREVEGGHPLQKTGRGLNPNLMELKYAQALVLAKDPSTLHGPSKSTALDVYTIMKENGGQSSSVKQPKYKTLAEIQSPNECNRLQFVDLLGEICRVFDCGPNVVEVKITDYTEHPLLFDYSNGDQDGNGKKTGWAGPSGRMTITINAWGEHAIYIRRLMHEEKIKLGMFMRFRNVQIKMDRNGSIMEGHLREGRNNFGNSASLLMSKEAKDDELFKELLQRRRRLGSEGRAQFLGVKDQHVTAMKKRPSESEEPLNLNEGKEKGKSAKKREKRRIKRIQEAETVKKSSASGSALPSLNQNVRCESIEIPLTTLSNIIQPQILDRKTPAGNPVRLPFQNCKYRSKVKVVDFFPDNLEDFAIPYKTSDYEALSDYESEDDEEASLAFARENPDDVRWEWQFFLMVEDSENGSDSSGNPETLILQVSGKDGDYLLDAEACDLRKDTTELAKLRQKLFVLWGDLEEKRIEHHATGTQLRQHGHTVLSRPFECFIREYGVKARNEGGEICDEKFERMFSIFATRIC